MKLCESLIWKTGFVEMAELNERIAASGGFKISPPVVELVSTETAEDQAEEAAETPVSVENAEEAAETPASVENAEEAAGEGAAEVEAEELASLDELARKLEEKAEKAAQ